MGFYVSHDCYVSMGMEQQNLSTTYIVFICNSEHTVLSIFDPICDEERYIP